MSDSSFALYVFQIECSERFWVVAHDADDAWLLFCESAMNEDQEPREGFDIRQLIDAEPVRIADDERTVSFSARSWCSLNGRGYLGGSVW